MAKDQDSVPTRAEGDGKDPLPTKPAETTHSLATPAGTLNYTARADWITLKRKQTPLAKVFHIAYVADGAGASTPARPVTFVFNGGPGAASAFLHLGALGPRRVAFDTRGTLPKPPAMLTDNAESWLPFTDLVFIDPVGTGFSRSLDRPKPNKEPTGTPEDDKENPEFWDVERDLDSLGEVITHWLSHNHRWESPQFIVGESYGGFRVAKLTRRLQEKFGVGLNGAVLVSPAIEFESLGANDYNVLGWIERFPTQVAIAHAHGRCRAFEGAPLTEALRAAEFFATTELLPWITTGNAPSGTQAAAERMSELVGLEPKLLAEAGGRMPIERFARELLREEHMLVGRYDGSVRAVDPYPDRPNYDGPDPSLAGIGPIFSAGINEHLRRTLKVETDLDYRLLSYEVNSAWQLGEKSFRQMIGSMDDLRYGVTLNPHTRVFVTHGYFDLVTPYYSSERLCNLMKLPEQQQARITREHYPGGHMFYSWDESREAFTTSIKRFYHEATVD